MTTGRGSKRNEQTTIALDDTDDDDDNDQPRQPASRNTASKRRRTILEDDDSDEVEVISPTRAGNNSNRLVKRIYLLSHKVTVFRRLAFDQNILYITITIFIIKTMSTFRLHSNNNIDLFILYSSSL